MNDRLRSGRAEGKWGVLERKSCSGVVWRSGDEVPHCSSGAEAKYYITVQILTFFFIIVYSELYTDQTGADIREYCALFSQCVNRFRCRQATRLSGVCTRRTSTSTSTFYRSFLRRDCAAPSTGTRATTCSTESPALHQQCKEVESSTPLLLQAGGQWNVWRFQPKKLLERGSR